MSAPNSVFSETLQSITTTKLEELAKKRQTFERCKTSVLDNVKAQPQLLQKVLALRDGVIECFGIKSSDVQPLALRLQVLDRFIEQARHDPSVSSVKLKSWHDNLINELDTQSSKFKYATLYGELVTEWLSDEKKSKSRPRDDDLEMSDSYEDISVSGKKLESRKNWEEAVFVPLEVDSGAVNSYLHELFDNDKASTKALSALRQTISEFEQKLVKQNCLTRSDLTWVIDGLLHSDLLTDEKKAVLKDFQASDVVRSELADVLNMRLIALSDWSWGDNVPVEQRRKVTGAYNIYMHEELIQALLLQFLGVQWSVALRGAFKRFIETEEVWETGNSKMSASENARLQHHLSSVKYTGSLDHKRARAHKNYFQLAQLLSHVNQQIVGEEGAEEAEVQHYPQLGGPVSHLEIIGALQHH